MKQNQFEFKPFDKVLTRNDDRQIWHVSIYSHYQPNMLIKKHRCIDDAYEQCIPYNEETQHLIGTNKPYQPKKKEIRYEVTFGFGEDLTVKSYTEEEFKNFINIAVINNKDIKDFTVNMIIPD